MDSRKKQIYRRTGIVCAVFLCLTGCGSSKSASAVSEQAAYNSNVGDAIYYAETEEEPAEEASSPQEAASVSVASNRKLIKTVSLEVETETFDLLVPKVESKAEALGGYIENLNLYNGSNYSGTQTKNADMTIRIPKDKLDDFVTEVAQVSNVIRREENVEDITLQYVDTKSHKTALETEQERLLALLEKAEDMESILALESRLSQIRYELQNMESQLRTYDNLVDYATVRISIYEVKALTPVAEQTAWEKMSAGFMRSLANVKAGIQNFFIGLVIALPYLLVIGIVILVLVLVILYFTKYSGLKKRKKEKQPEPTTHEE